MAELGSSSSPDSYAAGLIDGEGYIGIQETGGSFQVRLKVAMTDKGLPALHRLQARLGGRVRPDKSATEATRETHVWILTGQAASKAIRRLFPLLVVKSEPAQIALNFQAMVDQSQRLSNGRATWTPEMRRKAAEFKRRIQDANRRGPDPTPPSLPPETPLAVYRAGTWWEPEDDLFGPVEFDGPFPTSGKMIAGNIYPLESPWGKKPR